MKRICLLAILQMLYGLVHAQYTLQPTLPTAGMVQKSQLWSVLVVNSSANAINCRLELTLRDRTSGLEQLTATTAEFSLNKGAKQLNNTLLAPVQYNTLGMGFIKRGNDELLPIGNYTACYRLSSVGTKPAVLAEECLSFDIEPLSPPLLSFPADSSILAIQPSQFSWTPPSPAILFNQLAYDVLITEILPGQKPEEAMQQNLPFYTAPNTPYNMLAYKGMGAKLQKDTWYAWQVVARDERSYAAKSEVWVFKVKDSLPQANATAVSYYALSSTAPATVTIDKEKELFVQFYSYERDHEAKLTIQQIGGNRPLEDRAIKVSYGDNYLAIPIPASVESNKAYQLTLTDIKGKKHMLLFKKEKKD
jgi:hypothetical protein